MIVIDAHAHVTRETLPSLLLRMAENGINRTVVVAGAVIDPWQLAHNLASGRRSDAVADNDFVLSASKHDNRLIPFYFVNPNAPVSSELEQEVREFAGLKLAPAVHRFGFRDNRIREYAELARVQRKAIYSHCVPDGGADVEHYVRLASEFPDVPFILGHAGRHYFDLLAVETVVPAPNIYFETSGAFEYVVREAVRLLGTERIVFGSEFPLQGQATEIAKVRGALSEDVASKVLGSNLLQVLGGGAQAEETRMSAQRLGSELTTSRGDWPSAKAAFDYAFENVPHFRDRCLKVGVEPRNVDTQAQWSRVPFTTKEDLRKAYPFGMLAVSPSELAVIHESSGTTGAPTPSFLTRGDLETCYLRMLTNGIGLNSDDTVLIKTPYAMLSTAHQMHGAALRCGATVIPADNRSGLMPYARVVRLISAYHPTVLYCMPIELLLFARRALRLGKNPRTDFPWIRACLVNGEGLSPAKRRYLEDLWSTRLFEDYGSTETGSLGGDCTCRVLHLWENLFYYEVLDRGSGRAFSEGRGELVVTDFHRRAMPLVRFRTGDLVTVSRPQCACGSRSAVVRVHGRCGEDFAPGSQQVDVKTLENVVYDSVFGLGPVFWAAEIGDNAVRVQLECMADETDEVRRRSLHVRAEVSKLFGAPASVEVVPEGTIMRQDQADEEKAMHKARYISRIGQATHGLNYSV